MGNGPVLKTKPELIKASEARKMLGGCCSTTLRRYADRGLIVATQFNARRFLYHRSTIEAYLASRPRIGGESSSQ
jgi:hypothetical protein